MKFYGTVCGVDRDNNVARVRLDLGVGQVKATYPKNNAPPPLSRVWLDGGRTYVIRGVLGNRRVVFHDDFLRMEGAFTAATASAVDVGLGDTPWQFNYLGLGLGCDVIQGTGAQQGVCRIAAQGSGGAILKDGIEMDDLQHWLYGRVRTDCAFGTTGILRWGIQDSVLNYTSIEAFPSTSSNWRLNSSHAGFQVFDGTPYVADQWVWLDLCYRSGGFAAGWVNGNGPVFVLDPLPDNTDSQPAFSGSNLGSGVTDTWDIDVFHMETFDPGVLPDLAMRQGR